MIGSESTIRGAPLRALLVCHAGAHIGLGHLTRALVVAEALQRGLGAEVRLLVQGEAVRRKWLDRVSHRFVAAEADLAAEIAADVHAGAADFVIFDLHPGSLPPALPQLLSDLRRRGVRMVGIDCLLERCNDLDLTWIPSFRVDPARLAPCRAPVNFGWDAYLLSLARAPRPWAPGPRVLVLTGGSDTAGLGCFLPETIDAALPAGSEIRWVRGPYAPEPSLPKATRLRWFVAAAPESLDDLILETNYALTVFGVSCFELLQYGVPTVAFSPYGDKDAGELAGLAQEGVAWVAADARSAVSLLGRLMRDHAAARDLARSALARMSVRGADRFVQRIREMVS